MRQLAGLCQRPLPEVHGVAATELFSRNKQVDDINASRLTMLQPRDPVRPPQHSPFHASAACCRIDVCLDACSSTIIMMHATNHKLISANHHDLPCAASLLPQPDEQPCIDLAWCAESSCTSLARDYTELSSQAGGDCSMRLLPAYLLGLIIVSC